MFIVNLNDMIRGWFIGSFSPTVYETDAVEVGVKHYKKGEYERSHYHKIATEITVVIKGRVKMNQMEYEDDDIIVMEPGDVTDFEALTDTSCVVVKIPGVLDDKYLEEIKC